MRNIIFLILLATTYAQALENTTCKKCHPKIYNEYQNSMHKNASIYNDVIHNAIWQKHPLKKKGLYKCAKCHSPADKELFKNGFKLTENETQTKEPISCKSCHTIESIEEHTKANKNIYTKNTKMIFSANQEKKGTKLIYHDESSFFGLVKKRVGSPYHDIDYSNENYYNANMCMGCHSHKQNSKNFNICNLEVKEDKSGMNCITCHMPQIKGSYVNQKDSKTHAFHGVTSLVHNPKKLSAYIGLELKKSDDGFDIIIDNKVQHTIAPHPLRLTRLRVTITRDGKTIKLEDKTFQKVIGSEGKPTMPWLATEVLKDTLIKAFEKKDVHFKEKLQSKDEVLVEFGYHIVNPKIAKKLDIKDDEKSKFIVLTKKRFVL